MFKSSQTREWVLHSQALLKPISTPSRYLSVSLSSDDMHKDEIELEFPTTTAHMDSRR